MDQVLRYVGDEATTDQLLAHLAVVRERATTPIDRRGLDLLEMLARRKAAEVLNQPGQQVPLALAAMRRAFKPAWGTGERRLMADFLAGLGSITQQALAAEQLRELEALFRAEQDATPDHLHIATRWSATVRGYGGPGLGKALDILEPALDGFVAAHGGSLTSDAQGAFDQLIGWFESDKTFARGEKKILAALERDVNVTLRDWLVQRRFRLYMNAISSRTGRVSLGEGEELYQNVVRILIVELGTGRNDHRYQLCRHLIDIYRAAHGNAKIARAKEDIVAFGKGAFDEMIGFDTQNYQSLVQQLANTIHDLAGDLPALEFLIGRYEQEPESFRASGNGGWPQYGYSIAQYRAGANNIGDLAPRLLKIVLTELRRDLETQQARYQSIYHQHNSYFWTEKRGDFQQLAENIAKERKQSIVALRYIANYLFHGLDAYQPAIDILVDAHKRGIQDEAGISLLAGFFEYQKRHAEAVPYLREIVAINAGQADYRRRLITALGLSAQRDAAIAALDAAVSYFKEHKLWHESALSPLAQGCHDGKLWEQGVALYDELIPLHQRTQPNRGIGNGTLSHYYAQLSACHSQLGNTAMAVDAAAGAIISWGPTHQNRASALQSLKNVLANAKDLGAYVGELDKSVADSGLKNPIVRKALGQVYAERKEYQPALRHLRLAAESQPGDVETQQALIAVYDALGDGDGAIRQLLGAVALSPRNIALFQDLGARYEKLGRNDEAERARTSLVEALPNESEGHAMLAEIREAQQRWNEAARHWALVAAIRALEPTGLQRLAAAQLKLGEHAAAIATLGKLLAKEWPSRFGDVHGNARTTLAEVEKAARKGEGSPARQ
jgi:tetratricopeptide (TPR) repeat protein